MMRERLQTILTLSSQRLAELAEADRGPKGEREMVDMIRRLAEIEAQQNAVILGAIRCLNGETVAPVLVNATIVDGRINVLGDGQGLGGERG